MLLGVILTLAPFFSQAGPAQMDTARPQPFVLDETTWHITLTSIDAKGKKKTQTDTLTFSKRKIVSLGYEQKGCAPTNYSVSVHGDGVTTFAAMQMMKEETLFWKGEVAEDASMQGSLHLQDKEGNMKEYSMEGKLASGTLRRKGEKVAEPAPVSSGTAVLPVSESIPASPAGKTVK